MEPKKINWFKRIFMSWNKLLKYFKNEKGVDHLENEKKVAVQEETIRMLNEQLQERKAMNLLLEKQIIEKKALIDEQKNQITRYQAKIENDSNNNIDLKVQVENLKAQEKAVQAKLNDVNREKQDLDKNIAQKLETLHKIEKTFFGISGNKGKGELGELQLKNILEQSGITRDFWTENLPVGQKNVEFAIKSGEPDKWIPIDSKVIEPTYDDAKKPIINNQYENSVLKQVREITKYLNKKNTVSHGLLVLQNDEVYFKLYEEKPNLFTKAIRDYKVYITSPSLFVQFAFSISHIVDIYNKVSGEEQVYEELMKTLNHVQKFARAINEAYKKLRISVETHLPAIEKSYEKARTLDQGDKLKQLDLLSDES